MAEHRLSTGPLERISNKIKTMIKKSYGLKDVRISEAKIDEPLIARKFLDPHFIEDPHLYSAILMKRNKDLLIISKDIL